MATLASRLNDLVVAIRTKINAMVPRLLPAGGTTGNVLIRTIPGQDYAVGWASSKNVGTNIRYYFFTDLSHRSGQYGEFIVAAITSGSANGAVTETSSNHPGVLQFVSSTSANSGVYVGTAVDLLTPAGNEVFDCAWKMPATVSPTTTIRVGFMDAFTAAAPANGAYLEIVGTTATAKTRKASSETAAATTLTVVAGTWYYSRVTFDGTAANVRVQVWSDSGGSLLDQTISTNIPTTRMGVAYQATNTLTTATTLGVVDFLSLEFVRLLTRGPSPV